jgi:hypothetical protein
MHELYIELLPKICRLELDALLGLSTHTWHQKGFSKEVDVYQMFGCLTIHLCVSVYQTVILKRLISP